MLEKMEPSARPRRRRAASSPSPRPRSCRRRSCHRGRACGYGDDVGAAQPRPAHRPGRPHRAAGQERRGQVDAGQAAVGRGCRRWAGGCTFGASCASASSPSTRSTSCASRKRRCTTCCANAPARPAQAARAAGGVRAARRAGETEVGSLSGGQKARLSLLLATLDAPHLLILDEPTNHLDIESREALVEALTDYTAAR